MRLPQPQLLVGGQWLSALTPWGDLEWETAWPGGTEYIRFSVARLPSVCQTGALVEVDWAGQRLAVGSLQDPKVSEPLYAEGLHRQAEDYLAIINGTWNPAVNINDAINDAIVRGMKWVHGGNGNDMAPQPGVNGMPAIQPDHPVSIKAYLDASATERGMLWGVGPDRRPAMAPARSAATLHMAPGIEGLNRSRDNLVTRIAARYWNGSSYATVAAVDAYAEQRWGTLVERVLPEALADGETLDGGRAQALVDGAMSARNAGPGWTAPIEVQHGDLLTPHGQPVEPYSVSAGVTVRVHGLIDAVADLAGSSSVDVPIERASHKNGVTTLTPRGLVQPMNDVLAGVTS